MQKFVILFYDNRFVAPKNKLQLLNANIITPLLNALSSPEKSVKRASVSCLSTVTDTSIIHNHFNHIAEIHCEMKRKDLVASIVKTMNEETGSVEILDECAYALSNLSKDCKSIL